MPRRITDVNALTRRLAAVTARRDEWRRNLAAAVPNGLPDSIYRTGCAIANRLAFRVVALRVAIVRVSLDTCGLYPKPAPVSPQSWQGMTLPCVTEPAPKLDVDPITRAVNAQVARITRHPVKIEPAADDPYGF